MPAKTDPSKRSLTSLWLMLILFASPIVLASLIYCFKDKITFSTNQHGQFFAPTFNLTINNSKSTNNPKWKLLLLSDIETNQDINLKNNLIQIREILGNDKDRVDVIFSTTKDITVAEEIGHQALLLNNGRIIIIDPNGKAIMHYSKDSAPQWILKDIQRLLKYSNV